MSKRKMIILVLVAQAMTLVMAAAPLGIVPSVKPRLATAEGRRHFSLLASTMQPIDSSIGYDTVNGFLETTSESAINTSTAYIGQLDLPDGATIVDVRCLGQDTSPMGIEFSFRLYRYNLYSSPVGSPVTERASSGDQPGTIELSAQIYPGMAVIDNDQYSYGIFLELPTPYARPYQHLWVLRCVVDTSYNVHIPTVQRD